jgi:choline dehydrogenase-like flavoprotein
VVIAENEDAITGPISLDPKNSQIRLALLTPANRDPSRSVVCDAFGKFHDLDNLYCADGSVCVTGSGYNPTPTIIALAPRTAGAMVYPGSPERILENP